MVGLQGPGHKRPRILDFADFPVGQRMMGCLPLLERFLVTGAALGGFRHDWSRRPGAGTGRPPTLAATPRRAQDERHQQQP